MCTYLQAEGPSVTPPRYTIDLSLRPEERYKAVATTFAPQLRSLTGLFDGLLLSIPMPKSFLPLINSLSRLLLRKVYDDVQTRELQGISRVIGVPMYLLVAFNVVLDLLMGCTSGGVLSREPRQPQSTARMLHFRTLDWSMDPLRKVIAQLDFVRSASEEPEKILASSITYVGFVGVLTGVKPGLSMSLNFRAVHDATTRKEHFQFYLHHLLVLFGWRPSIASLLRSYLIPPDSENGELKSIKCEDEDDLHLITSNGVSNNSSSSLADQACEKLISNHTTAAYVIFSDGKQTHIVEKDYDRSQVASSTTFIARTNHDVCGHQPASVTTDQASMPAVHATLPIADHNDANPRTRNVVGLTELLDESKDRLVCIEAKWTSRLKHLRSRARREKGRLVFADNEAYVSQKELVNWVSSYTTTNECTHFAAVMDPVAGTVVWCRAYPDPLYGPSADSSN